MSQCSIVIPHYDQLSSLDRCIRALIDQHHPASQYEIIVVDNGSENIEDHNAEWKQTCTQNGIEYRLIINKIEKNPYVSRNLGLAAAQHPYIALLDARCVPSPQWLSSALSAVAWHDIVAGRFQLSYPDDRLSSKVHGLLYLNNQKNTRLAYGVPAGNIMLSADIIQQIGPYGTQSSSGEDIAWSKKAIAQGYDIRYAPDMLVTYPSWTYSQLLPKVKKYARGAKAVSSGSRSSLEIMRSFLPLRWSTFREALRYRDLMGLPLLSKVWLYLLAWRVKVIYAWWHR